MKRRSLVRFAAMLLLCLLLVPCGSTHAATIPWNVRVVQSAGTAIVNIPDADALLDGTIANKADVSALYPTLNFNKTDYPSGGHFAGDVAFAGISPGHDTDFALQAAGSINIPSPGAYTFGVSSDDGFLLNVAGHTSQYTNLRAPAQSFVTYTFASAGTYPLNLVYFQHLVSAELEFFASPGAFTAFGQSGSNFQLVGNTSAGGLSLVNPNATLPEPTTCLLLLPVTVGLIARRKI